MHLLQSKWLKY